MSRERDAEHNAGPPGVGGTVASGDNRPVPGLRVRVSVDPLAPPGAPDSPAEVVIALETALRALRLADIHVPYTVRIGRYKVDIRLQGIGE